MLGLLTINFKNSIAVELIKYVFGFYFILASAITIFHMVLEYNNAKGEIRRDLVAVYHSFGPGLIEDVYMVDYGHAKQLLQGMIEFPSIIGVSLEDEYGKVIQELGTTKKGEASGMAKQGVFGEVFVLSTEKNGKLFNLGKLTVFSSSRVILDRVQLEFLLLIGNAILKTLTLWTIFIVVSKGILVRPLEALKSLTSQVDFENLKEISIPGQEKKVNELTAVEDAFNGMIRRMEQYNKEIRLLNKNLEQRVESRTRALKDVANHLKKREEQIKSILETSDEGFWMIDNETNTLEVNKSMLHILGWSRDEVFSKKAENFFDEANFETFEHQVHMRNQGQTGAFEISVKHVSGVETPCLFNSTPLYDDEKKRIGSFAMVTDISKQKEVLRTLEQRTEDLDQSLNQLHEKHQELKHTQTQLVHSEKMAGLGTLVAGVAHEINNPVNFLCIGAESMEATLERHEHFLSSLLGSEPEIMETLNNQFERLHIQIESINDGSERIKTIVSDLRTFSRLDEAERKHVKIVKNLQSTLRLIQTQFKDKIDFDCDFEDDPMLDCWPAQLNQVFMNLMVNACQAIDEHQNDSENVENGLLTLSTKTVDDCLEIRFADTGCGMTEDVKQKIFEPFFTTKSIGAGTGMGMAISYGIIERHKGKIEIESAVGVGTTIVLRLPIEPI